MSLLHSTQLNVDYLNDNVDGDDVLIDSLICFLFC